jgi:hypothetical protein
MNEGIKEKRDVVFAIFLIFIGSIFLLNTTGVVGWGIWEYILRFWPVFLILAGIKLILGHSVVTEILITAFAVVLFAIVGIFSYVSYTQRSIPLLPLNLQNYIIENPDWLIPHRGNEVEESTSVATSNYEDILKRRLNINVGASKFNLTDEASEEEYISLNSIYTKGYIEPSLKAEKKDSVLEISFDTVSPRHFVSWGVYSTEFNLSLGSVEIPNDIYIILGAGEGSVDLNRVGVGELDCKIGAGQLTATLDSLSIPEKINMEIGAGSMILNIPEEVGYTISYDLGVGEISENGNEIAASLGKKDTYTSSNYEEAEIKIEIVAKVGVGSLEINNI